MKLLPYACSPFTFDTNSSVPGESPETTFEKIYIVGSKRGNFSVVAFSFNWTALLIMKIEEVTNRRTGTLSLPFEKCMPGPITEAVQARAYLHPFRLLPQLSSRCCLKLIGISYLGNMELVPLWYRPQPN